LKGGRWQKRDLVKKITSQVTHHQLQHVKGGYDGTSDWLEEGRA
jgi:hypothetical protein